MLQAASDLHRNLHGIEHQLSVSITNIAQHLVCNNDNDIPSVDVFYFVWQDAARVVVAVVNIMRFIATVG